MSLAFAGSVSFLYTKQVRGGKDIIQKQASRVLRKGVKVLTHFKKYILFITFDPATYRELVQVW